MSEPPAVVIYMIDPFSYGVDNIELQRLSSMALLRCFSDILYDQRIPESIRQSVYLQTVSLETVYSIAGMTMIPPIICADICVAQETVTRLVTSCQCPLGPRGCRGQVTSSSSSACPCTPRPCGQTTSTPRPSRSPGSGPPRPLTSISSLWIPK